MLKKVFAETRSILLLIVVIAGMIAFKQVDTLSDEEKTYIDNFNNTNQTETENNTTAELP
ncbi:hypothetical protein [Halobacillus sp. Marseille-Q1614]|uniref:hypothetical protein n=1 Tax=Halobacillus sp. Marseille-Q1614 TaxID=2709134 RepID=UPI00156EE38D|nr:hypothetical protein [Halobacillus sp. Marseille-Q1614]